MASGPVFIFCAPGHVFDGTEDVGSLFHILHARTLFRRNRGRLLLFSCIAFPNSFSAVLRVPGAAFMFCAPGNYINRVGFKIRIKNIKFISDSFIFASDQIQIESD
jgi:hypothetical protein